ncbi:acetyl esterase/lipase [Variovorax sp. TBS-050B]|uniref:alpha/beta hydrolase n=1 Tax=Variovorax sp. TBS-050B TaxID=2940551 RepID=UPI0024762385|nr:alpha/beta hydrolase [Variovorax sp. TBS-050B]MDH6591872.1 acetyl esterase/lipase [Variovorax sp. TBS-050B]
MTTAEPSSSPPIRRRRSAFLGLLAAAAAGALSACSPIKLLNGLVPGDTYRFEGGIAYGPAPRQRLDVYQPLPDALPVSGQRPLVVFFYGGAWTGGDRASYRFLGEALAARGAVVVVPDYGLSPSHTYPVFVRDSALAVKWALDNAARLGADPKRVHVMGHSSGGYNAAMVALDARWLAELGASPAQLAGWIGLAGPYDFLPIGDRDVQLAFNWPDTPRDSQPIAHAGAASPRTLLLAASKDNLVYPERNTLRLAAALRAAKVPVDVHLYDNLSHVTLMGAFARPIQWLGGPVLPPVVEFLGLPSAASYKARR